MSSSRRIHSVKNLDEMRSLAHEVVSRLPSREIWLLSGTLGAGKTQFVSHLVEALGGRSVASPSFAVHHSYSTPRGEVEHFDLYRLENEDDLESTGFWDVFASPKGYIAIEWAERLDRDVLPANWPIREFIFSVLPDGVRQIEERS